MSQLLRYLSMGLVLFTTIASVHAESLIPSEVESYLTQHNLKLTTKAEDAQKAGYILVMGTGKGPRHAAKRAATVAAQREIAALLAELPARHTTATKQVLKTPTHTKTTVSGKVKQASPVFSFYQAEQETSYLLMRKPLTNQR
ncbi:hypothetical protein SAMN02745119_03291 [Trichlorobacter thiogenes]|uniref:Uncharacterized protein n=1 Tax=Trichlorobacter thiogenes TaxID=115783 RepID=A0A1T4S6B0_9BACT|nr:hypothetical protein [Trichlorobacter thiogenes]SKA23850.1 hypothetical protein SAMN02745119_03291 [Trichlorobacter thiogenes]